MESIHTHYGNKPQGSLDTPVVDFSAEAKTFNWLLGSFTTRTTGVQETIVVSADGLLMARSSKQDQANSDRLAAVVCGMTSLAAGAAEWYRLLVVTSISRGSVLGVIASKWANLGTVAYEMTLFGARAGATLTPGLIAELKSAVRI